MIRGLGICVPVTGEPGGAGVPVEALADVAVAAEAAGVASLWLAEAGPAGTGPDAVTLAGALARLTRTCTIGVRADLRTGRAPSLLAKEMTAVDVLSGGRAALALTWGGPARHRPLSSTPGAGGADPVDIPAGAAPIGTEPAAAGMADRARWVDEAATICLGMWRQPAFTFTGRHLAVTDAVNHPGPLQAAGPPLLLALPGRARALAVAARHGAGLLVTGPPGQVARLAGASSAARPPLVAWRRWPAGRPAAAVAAELVALAAHTEAAVVALAAVPASGGGGGPQAAAVAAAAVTALATAYAAALDG